MVGEIVMLPVRVGVRATRLWLRALEETVSITTDVTGRVVGLLASRSPNGDGAGMRERPATPAAPAAPAAPRPTERETHAPAATDLRSAGAVQTPVPPPAAEPAHLSEEPTRASEGPGHVSEEPVLVEAFAEPGAEDGAGAEVHVNPPWDGYERMTAKEVIARLASANPAELAAVQLYEANNRQRQTIVNAVKRELRGATAGSQRNKPQTPNHQRG